MIKVRALALASLLCATVSLSQTPVDQLCSRLERQALFPVEGWRFNPGITADGMRLDCDDSGWPLIAFNQQFTPDSAWMRASYTVPALILGQKPAGRLEILLEVDDAGILYVDGENKGRFDWNGRFTLSENASPGQHFDLAIKAINTGGPMRLIQARLHYQLIARHTAAIESYLLSLRVGQKLTSGDTYLQVGSTRRDEGIDRSTTPVKKRAALRRVMDDAAMMVKVDALEAGRFDEFNASLQKSRQALQPVAKFAKEFTLVLDANAHIDCAWLWRYPETIQVARNTFTSVLDMMDARPDFTYTQSQAHLYWWMENLYPDLFARIKSRVQDGRWEVTGGMWVEPDCNLISGESWARQLLYGKRYFREKLGVDVSTGWNPDSFGYNWNMPQFYREAGIQAFITQKIGWNDTNMFPYRLFWWEGPDGSRLLTYFPYDYVNDLTNPRQLTDWLRQFDANTGLKKMLVLYGVGDHGGGPTPEMLNQAEAFKQLDIFPAVVYGTAREYLAWLGTHDLAKLPVWKDELYLEYHRGTATTQSETKKNNRECEILFGEAEQLAALAALDGQSYPREEFGEGWRGVLFNQFHDILPGSSIHGVYRDSDELYAASREIGQHIRNSSLDFLANRAPAARQGKSFIVYNPLAWPRSDLVSLELPAEMAEGMAVFDAQGLEIPSQLISVREQIPGQNAGRGRYQRRLIFIAREIPAAGYAVYALRPRTVAHYPTTLRSTPTGLESPDYAIEMDSRTGFIKRIWDKRNRREVLRGQGNELQLFKDIPKQYDAWEIALSEPYAPAFRRMQIVETGPVRTVLRVEHDFLKPGIVKGMPTPDNPESYFSQDIILYDGLDRIDFVTQADWWEEHVALKVAFAVNADDSTAAYEIPFGTIRRPTTRRNSWEKARHEVSMQKWCDLSDPAAGYGITLLNRAKYGGDIKENVMRLTLLRSPLWPDPLADRGKHTIEYALLAHAGDWQEGNAMRRGYEYNYPLLAQMISSAASEGPSSRSFVTVDAPNVILHTIKGAEAPAANPVWILRLFEFTGKSCDPLITLPRTVKKANLSNFMEEEGIPLPVEDNRVRLHLAPNRIATVKVEME
jgi:alpha-mannosidase